MYRKIERNRHRTIARQINRKTERNIAKNINRKLDRKIKSYMIYDRYNDRQQERYNIHKYTYI